MGAIIIVDLQKAFRVPRTIVERIERRSREFRQQVFTKFLDERDSLFCGVDTDACVLGVAFALFDAGIDCEVDPELCWSSTGLQEPALKIVREQFGTG